MKNYEIENGNITHIITEEDNGKALRDILRKLRLSRAAITRYKKADAIQINGISRRADEAVRSGEILTIIIGAAEEIQVEAENAPLDILYEDEFLLAINKPAGMPSHPSRNIINGTLANIAAGYLLQKEAMPGVHLVNRLDRNTSGIVLIAKSSYIKHLLSQKLSTMHKKYIAIAEGNIETDNGLINAPIARAEDGRIERCVREDGQSSITSYQVIVKKDNYSLLEVSPQTGRTHQIRVHLAYLGHPLAGDTMYGGHDEKIARHALHAWHFGFHHPVKHKDIFLYAPLPEDMIALLKKIQIDISCDGMNSNQLFIPS